MEILDQKINEYANRHAGAGEIGIEIECEGSNLPVELDNKLWRAVADGSLRNGGMEYVLRAPVMYKDVGKALEGWKLATSAAKFDFTIRTSVHIHVNIGDYTVRQALNVFAAYWLLENVLVGLNGKDRVGNLFCLRVKDAESLPLDLVRGISKKRFLDVCNEHYRYSALNPAAMLKYGSAEFRFIKGTDDIKRIKFWVDALYRLVTRAKDFRDPKNILAFFDKGRMEFMYHFLTPEVVDEITRTYPTSYIDMIGENYVHILNMIRAMQNAMDKQEFFKPYIATENEDLDKDEETPYQPKKSKFKNIYIDDFVVNAAPVRDDWVVVDDIERF